MLSKNCYSLLFGLHMSWFWKLSETVGKSLIADCWGFGAFIRLVDVLILPVTKWGLNGSIFYNSSLAYLSSSFLSGLIKYIGTAPYIFLILLVVVWGLIIDTIFLSMIWLPIFSITWWIALLLYRRPSNFTWYELTSLEVLEFGERAAALLWGIVIFCLPININWFKYFKM